MFAVMSIVTFSVLFKWYVTNQLVCHEESLVQTAANAQPVSQSKGSPGGCKEKAHGLHRHGHAYLKSIHPSCARAKDTHMHGVENPTQHIGRQSHQTESRLAKQVQTSRRRRPVHVLDGPSGRGLLALHNSHYKHLEVDT
jgi:hypothetical protein